MRVQDKYRIIADYSQWRGKWLHFSKTPFLKINPQQFHGDPSGLYFFPEKFRSEGCWHHYQYKFVAEVDPNMSVLDLATLKTEQDVLDLYKKLGLEPSEYFHKHKSSGNLADLMWDDLKQRFPRKPGTFNKALRNAGYDAVFDDTGSIFTNEVQLIVLNPSKITKYERIDRKGTGYELVNEVVSKLSKILSEYGKVEAHRPVKRQESGRQVTVGKLRVVGPDYDYENYVGPNISWEVSVLPGAIQSRAPDEITIQTVWTSGRGFYHKVDLRDFSFEPLVEKIRAATEKLFAEQRLRAEEYRKHLSSKQAEPVEQAQD